VATLATLRPVVPGSNFFDNDGPLAFAHRGGAAEAPENTWAAFERSESLGFRYMETDVRVTADAVPVAIHDPDLGRVTGRRGRVSSMTWPQLKDRALADGKSVPRLDELLAAWPDLRWNIDVKEREAIGPVIQAIDRAGGKDRVLVASFADRRAARVSAVLGPGLATGAGRWTVAALLGTKVAPFVHLHPRAAAAQVPMARNGIRIVDAGFVRACHRAGVAVHVWTIDDPTLMAQLLDLGVDGIMTDRPSVLKHVFQQKGVWPTGA
jgi:glycerophosphoryl diester phosphodiesterase